MDLLKQGKDVPEELQDKLTSKIKTSTPKSSEKQGTGADQLNEKVIILVHFTCINLLCRNVLVFEISVHPAYSQISSLQSGHIFYYLAILKGHLIEMYYIFITS